METKWLIQWEQRRNNSYAMSAFPNLLIYKLFIDWINMRLKTNSVSWLQLMCHILIIMDTFQ